ncbi:MAG: aspartate--tRNA(Asn) ligase [archaeon]
MERVLIKEVKPELDNKEITLAGWIHDIRDMSNIKFIVLRDESGMVQVVAPKNDVDSSLFDEIPRLQQETVISVDGVVKASKQAKAGVEILLKGLTVLSKSEPSLPIAVAEKGVETALSKRLDYRCLDLRKPRNRAIFNVQSALVAGMEKWLQNNGYIQVFTPCIMGAASESGSEVFKIQYYETQAFLRQDPQLHRQLTIAGGIEKLYDIGPSWRAEKSHTTKHICEHRACAVEQAFIKDESELLRAQEALIVSALTTVRERCSRDLQTLGVEVTVPKTPFPELRFPKIYEILAEMGKKCDGDLDTEAEGLLWEYVKKKYGCEFYFFNRFPSKIKPFYVMFVDEDPKWARSIDLNFRGVELSSGGQREHRYDKIMEHVRDKGMTPESVKWFTEFFRYGVPPHGGFAIGIERLTKQLLNLENIREAVLFPRDPERLEP